MRAQFHSSVVDADILRLLDLFAGLPESELDQIAECGDLTTAHPGQVVQAQDVPVRFWHVVVAGHAVVHRDATPSGSSPAAIRGPSIRCSTDSAPPSPWWRCHR